ncbi:hypothetical protein [Alcanivorax sp.]|jgi:UDP-N-acetyl-D-glucosamine dehydrogenase|uniref:hypothetical protein n=1 Tax=Alcanivorax sp. TaxID=1872427 RepID=UPI0032D8CD82
MQAPAIKGIVIYNRTRTGETTLSNKAQLIEKLEKRIALIDIIGLRHIWIPLAMVYSNAGYIVWGIDIDLNKVAVLNHGKTYIERITATSIHKALQQNFSATSAFSEAQECDALIICVPTPLSLQREPDISYIADTMDSLTRARRPGKPQFRHSLHPQSRRWPYRTLPPRCIVNASTV